MPVLINALGSYRRMEMALGCDEGGPTSGGFDALGGKIGALVKPEPPSSFKDLIAKARQFAPLLRIPPKRARRGVAQERVLTGDEIDLRRLPLIQCWPLDGDLGAVGYPADVNGGVPGADLAQDPEHRGRYITFAGIHTIHADDENARKPSSHNIGMYRVQLIGRRHLAMHWHMHHDGARHWRSWKRSGRRMPVAIALGGDACLPFAAIAPLPPGISELLFAGFLRGRGVPLVPCRTVPVRAPADAEIIIEGWVSEEAGPPGYDPRDPEAGPLGPGAFFEGPFGDHTGFYSLPDRYPVLEVTAVTMRSAPVYPTTIVGLPPQEDYYMGKAVERLFLPLLRTIVHDIEDYDLPLFGAFHNCAFLQIRKEYPLQARRVMHAIWGAGQMAWTKMIVVVDEDVNVHDAPAVMRAVGERCDPRRDIETVRGPLDILDHAAPRLGAGTKIGFDATRKITGEELAAAPLDDGVSDDIGGAPQVVEAARNVDGVADARTLNDGDGRWLLAKTGDADLDGRAVAERLADALAETRARFAILLGPDVDLDDFDQALFHWCANMDPGRDSIRRGGTLLFDATPKRPGATIGGEPVRDWPPLITMSEDMRAQVDRRWREYGLDQ